MKKTYYNLGEASVIMSEAIGEPEAFTITPFDGKKKYFHNCIYHEIAGKTYILTPLSEMCRVYEISESAFLEDEWLDIMNRLAKDQGYIKLVTIETD